MANHEPGNIMGLMAARAQADEDFRQRLLTDPEKTLREEGIRIPPEIKVKVLENTADLIHIILPAKQEALDEEALNSVTGGWFEYKSCGNYNCFIEYYSPMCRNLQELTNGECKDKMKREYFW
ncbi:MAG: NHLP leader peptide family natural product precursor [Firmicutes bacterium]|jgi:hypothetical protein|nr:NHLP leader peptide family natural product precursor [Bacillota bacterium]